MDNYQTTAPENTYQNNDGAANNGQNQYYQQPQQYNQYQQYQQFQPYPQPKDGTAIASLVLGIMSFVLCETIIFGIVLGIVAIVLGASARSYASKFGFPKGVATTGLVFGIIGIVLSVLFIFLIYIAASGLFYFFSDAGMRYMHEFMRMEKFLMP